MSSHNVEQIIFDVASALLVPVLLLALFALAVTIFEAGALIGELLQRRGRSFARIEHATAEGRAAIDRGDRNAAAHALEPVARSNAMGRTLHAVIATTGRPDQRDRAAKLLADFDYGSLKRLERTRMLVRAGPALGLMGTLIPLSPALSALAKGDVASLSNNLRVAFSVTVLGLLIGALAFGISLIRDRLYGQDLSDLEYVTAGLTRETVDADLVEGHV
jgi:biopolymer transport protein ExbB/TolQ